MADPYLSSVSLLLLANGTDGATTFTDSSPIGATVTTVGSAHVSTATPPVGTGFLALSEITMDGLSVPGNSAYNIAGDFTVEMYVSVSGTERAMLLDYANDTAATGWYLYLSNGGYVEFYVCSGGMQYTIGSPTSLRGAGWKHIAATFRAATGGIEFFVNGVSSGTTSAAFSIDAFNEGPLYIGKKGNTTADPTMGFTGGMDCIRITKGVRRYTGAFTPPVASDFGDSSLMGTTFTASAALVAPSTRVTATGTMTTVGRASLAPHSPVAYIYAGSSLMINAPRPSLYAAAHDSAGELAANLAAPSPMMSFYGGANSTLTAPRPVGTATGTATISAAATLSAPRLTLSAEATKIEVSSAALTTPSPNLIGYGGAVCSITLTGRSTLTASGTRTGGSDAALVCPLFQLTANATVQNHGGANLLAPSPRMGQTAQAWLAAPGARLTAIGTAVVTATYEAYAINLKQPLDQNPSSNYDAKVDAVTHYTNFPFTHVVRYKNSYYGANTTGLYLLEGTTDDATPIPWAVKTAMTDFKSPTLKTVASAYFSGRFGPASNITLSAGEKAPVAYSFTTPRGALAQNHRQAFGRGLKARYYALAASGTGTCEIDAIELDVHNLTRRI